MNSCRALLCGAAVLALLSSAHAGEEPSVQAWWVDPLTQLLQNSTSEATRVEGRIDAARGEVEAIQLAVRSREPCSVVIETDSMEPGLTLRIRTVGRVPIRRGTHHTPLEERVADVPVDLPDPLFNKNTLDLKADCTESFWLDVTVPATAEAKDYEGAVRVRMGDKILTLPLLLRVHPVTVPFECTLPVTHWFSVRPELMGFGEVEIGSDDWWACADLLFESMWAHRQNMFWTPLREPWIRPEVTEEGKLDFDFSFFDRWVEAFSCPRGGERKTYIEGQPIATRKGYDGHVKARVWRIEDHAPKSVVLEVKDPAAREGYRVFLEALRDHLKKRGWLDRFRIHITDEPHGHQLAPYGVVAGYVREFAPEFKIMEALDVKDDFAFFEKHCDVWVPQLGRFDKSLPKMMSRLSRNDEVWIYTCLFPNGRYPNRFVDYPLIKTRILPWICFKWGFSGYLHWGFNHWRGDPFLELEPHHAGTTHLPAGDAWIVYPGKKRVLDSIRHEAFRDGVEDYELLKILQKRDAPKARIFADRILRSFTDYARDVKVFRTTRRALLETK